MVKITLSLWDIAGQERFDFFKTDFYNGVAAVGLVFDLARPDTFEKIDEYFKEIRERSGNVPIVLVGNKDDLKESVGETIVRQKIIEKMNQYDLLEYIETSALKQHRVEELFNKLACCALLDLQPRLGEIVTRRHFRFKVLLAGPAAVGKSSLIEAFANHGIDDDYKITIGLDFMTQEFKIPYDALPSEVQLHLREITKKYKRFRRTTKEKVKTKEKKIKLKTEKNVPFQVSLSEEEGAEAKKVITPKSSKKKYIYLSIIGIAIIATILILLQFLP